MTIGILKQCDQIWRNLNTLANFGSLHHFLQVYLVSDEKLSNFYGIGQIFIVLLSGQTLKIDKPSGPTALQYDFQVIFVHLCLLHG